MNTGSESIGGYIGRLVNYVTNPEICDDPDNSEKLEEKAVACMFLNFSFSPPTGQKSDPKKFG